MTEEKKVEEKKTPVKKTPAKVAVKTYNDLYKILSAPIPKEYLINYTEDGKEFTGYQTQYAIDLLNKEVGIENIFINEEILKQEMIGKAWLVVMKVEIIISYGKNEKTRTGKDTAQRAGFGGAFAKRAANAYKGAKTSAFKNACRYYGIGAELYSKGFDEDISVDETDTSAGKEETTAETPAQAETSEESGGAEGLIQKIADTQTVADLEGLRNTVSTFEAGDAVKKLLLKKFNDKLIAFNEQNG